MPRRLLLGLLAVAAVGLAVRWTWVLAVDPTVPDVGDASAYHLLAEGLADGEGYVRPFDRVLFDERRPTAEYPPLHPAIVSLAAMAGVDGVTGQRLWLSLFGAGSVAATGVLAWRLSGGRERAALAAAAIAAVHPLWFQADATLMPETVAALLAAGVVAAAVDAARRPSRRTWIVLGAACGLATLARAEALLLLVAVAVPAVIAGVRRTRPAVQPWKAGLVPLVAAVAVIAPWTIRNMTHFDELVPVSTNVGSVLDGANCDATYGGDLLGYWQFSETCFQGFTQRELAFLDDESLVADEHRHQGTSYATAHIGDWPKVALARLGRTAALFRPQQLADLAALEGREQSAELAGYGLLWATVIAGGVGAVRLRRAGLPWWVPASAVVVVWGSTAFTYGNPRFLAAAQPSLVALAACGVTRR